MRGNEEVPLTGKAFDALAYFVTHAGALVSRDELIRALWPDTITEDNSLTQAVSAVRRALGDEHNGRRLIVTVARRGYQFAGQVRAIEDSTVAATTAASISAETFRARPRRPAAWLTGLVLAGVLTAAAALLLQRDDDLSDRQAAVLPRSVAVLPFRNLSPNGDDAYFAAGLHEEILSQLAKVRALTVIARTSVMGYADTKRPIPEIAAELRVGAVLEGSASRAGERIRVGVQLVDASTNALFWSETYDRDVRDVFDIQADIARRIAAALTSELSASERTNIDRPLTHSLEAYAHYLRALALFRESGGIGAGMHERQRAIMQSDLDRAISLDPGFAAAYAWKASLHVDSLFSAAVPEALWPEQRDEWMRLVDFNIGRALQFEPATAMAYVARARLAAWRGRLAEGEDALEHARRLSPNDPDVLQQLGLYHCLRGDFPAAIAIARRALEIDPKNPGTHAPLQVALQASGDIAGAAAASEGMIAASPRSPLGYMLLARSEIARGNHQKAREALQLAEEVAGANPITRTGASQIATGYRRIGAIDEAHRALGRSRQGAAGMHVDAGLLVLELLAYGDYDRALEQTRTAMAARPAGMDPFLLLMIERNMLADPVLETAPWLRVRTQLGQHR